MKRPPFCGCSCLTLRDNTERPITMTHGTNTLVGSRPKNLADMAFARMADSNVPRSAAVWDGCAAERNREEPAGELPS